MLYKLKYVGISGEGYKLLENYLLGRFQKVFLNGQNLSRRPASASVPQIHIMGPLLCLVYIIDLSNELKCNVKNFADDTSLFTIGKDKNENANILKSGLLLITKWAYN